MVDTVTLEIGQNVLLHVEEEPRQGIEPAQTLLLQTEERTVLELVARREIATLKNVVST